MFHFFVSSEQITDNEIRIKDSDYNHIKNVIRLKTGEQILVSEKKSDESFKTGEAVKACKTVEISEAGNATEAKETFAMGSEAGNRGSKNYLCELVSYTDTEAIFEILEKDVPDTELPCRITLYQGLPKSDKMEFIIQKAVELGVYDIVPVAMKRCVVKLDDKKEGSKLKRWNAISESAAKQSKRSIIPAIRSSMSYKQVLEEAKKLDVVLVPYENEEGMRATREVISGIKPGQTVGIIIGPEGGFEDSEIEAARNAEFNVISLGKRILRTETAGLSALSMITYAIEDIS